MSLLISGVKMPRDGEMIDLVITSDGIVRAYDNENEKIGKAVELPKHGALIDADWLKEKCKEPKVWWETETQMKRILANAPVVIPAERGLSPVMPITNADRIRQMSDDELATLFGDACACLYDDADVCEKWGGACDRCWLDWLKQEAESSKE